MADADGKITYAQLRSVTPTTMANLPANVPMHMAIKAVTAIITNIYKENKQTKAKKSAGDLVLSREELRRALVEARD